MKTAVVFAVVLAALAAACEAGASGIVDRNASGVGLAADTDGQAMVSYRAHGRVFHVRVWGAINARHPTTTRPQVKFRMD